MDEDELISQLKDSLKPIDVPPNYIQIVTEALDMVNKTMGYDSKPQIFQEFDNMLAVKKLKEMLHTDDLI